MEWPVILGIVLAVPVILFPVAFVWYLNVAGIYQAVRAARARKKRRVARQEAASGEERRLEMKPEVLEQVRKILKEA